MLLAGDIPGMKMSLTNFISTMIKLTRKE